MVGRRTVQRLRYASSSEVMAQLRRAGYLDECRIGYMTDTSVQGVMTLETLTRLLADDRFAKGSLHLLHPEIPDPKIDARAWSGTFGKGSLQLVVCRDNGAFHADVDRWNPYQDVVNGLGHAGEVINGWWRRV